MFLDETEDTYCVWRTEYRRGLCTYYMDLFTLAEDGSLGPQTSELHRQRCYAVEQLTGWLAGGRALATFASTATCRLRRPRDGEQRVYFCAREDCGAGVIPAPVQHCRIDRGVGAQTRPDNHKEVL